MGWDVARSGDSSVLAVTVGRRVDRFDELPGIDLMDQVALAVSYTHKHRVQDIAVDAVGLGMGVHSRLAENLTGAGACCSHGHVVKAFNASKAADDPSRFFNVKTELLLHLRRMMEDRQIGLPPRNGSGQVERLSREMAAMKLVETMRGAARAEDPSESPDYLDALLIALSLRSVRRPGVAPLRVMEASEAFL